MTYTVDLTDGLAALIADTGLATYRPDGVYTDTETGITVGVIPDAPDRILCLTPYPVEDTDLTDATTGIQVRMRAGRDPRDAQRLSDALFDLLHNRRGLLVGGIHVALCWRQSQAWIGQDAKGRMELTANYYLRTTRTATYVYD